MKYANIEALYKHLKDASQEHRAPVYAILVKDDFERKEVVDHLAATLIPEKDEFSRTLIDASKKELDQVMPSLKSNSLFSKKRIVIVQQADKITKPTSTYLEEYFAKPNPDVTLILSAPSLHKGTKFYKNAEKFGVILEIPEEKPWEKEKSAVAHVVQKAKSLGKQIHPQAAQELVKQIGSDAGLLHQELEKLYLYVEDRPEITLQDVNAISTQIHTDSIWQLMDAIFQRKAGDALTICHHQISSGDSLFPFLRLIRSQFQTKLQIASILASGGSPVEVSQRFPQFRGRNLDNQISYAKNWGVEKLSKGILSIDQTELLAKSCQVDHLILAETLLAKLTS